MLGNGHVRSGGRGRETDRLRGQHRALPRPNSRIPAGEGPLWLASVRDACSRRIVGWKTSDRADTDLVVGALEYAVWGRGLDGNPGQRRLIHHSDRGAQGGFN
jgi:putative transposase